MSGPFGIEQGLMKNDINVGKEISPYLYHIPDVPKSHSRFPDVYAQITPENGVSFIRAKGRLIKLEDNDGQGLDVQNEFNFTVEKLIKTYGKPLLHDRFINQRSQFIYRGKDDWCDSIIGEVREFYAEWGMDIAIELPNNLKKIHLGILKEDDILTLKEEYRYGFNLYLEYTFNNFQNAADEINRFEDDVL